MLGPRRIIDYAIAHGKAPVDFMESDLTDWAQSAIRAGRSYECVRMVKAGFRRLIFEAGLSPGIPGLRPPVDSAYGVPFSEMPNPLHDQVIELLKWKMAELAPDRPQRARIRPICAESLKRELCRIYGFLTKVLGKTVLTLPELLSQEPITAFVSWCLNERKVCGRSVEIGLGRICGVRAYPLWASMDFTWVRKLMAQLPKRRETEIQEKKDGKWLPCDVVAGIPELIRRDAVRDRTLSEQARAEMMRDAFLMQFMTTLPWRTLNIRQRKLIPFSKGGNLYITPGTYLPEPGFSAARPTGASAIIKLKRRCHPPTSTSAVIRKFSRSMKP